ncbi:SHC-transforming protein 1 isoform X2 [Nematostella vectensis]|uniref:SHC-transforming protein 1 isoform X2 n=1 Tax=Nematostella vectensis TaxID=45351 RepID=UPI0020770B95|nr:SHC-transforming protein 1 isoform X2 [Nematostella vectensis]
MFGKKKINDPSNEWTKTGSFLHKPDRGWLHSEGSLREGGVCYAVKYVGCLSVEKSMRTLPYEVRQQVTREAILRCCEAAGYPLPKRKKPHKNVSRILGETPNMNHSGTNVNLTISATGMKMVDMNNGRRIANHDMQGISFASGGEKDCVNMVGYVAKDEVNGRACHVCDCGGELAYDVINTVGQAFEIRFKMFLQNPPQAMEVPGKFSETSIFDDPGEPQYNEIGDYSEPKDAGFSRQNRAPSDYQVPPPVRNSDGGYAKLRSTSDEGVAGLYDSADSYRNAELPKIPGSGYAVPFARPDSGLDLNPRESLDFAAGAIYDNPEDPDDGRLGFYNNPLAGASTDPRLPARMDSLSRDDDIPEYHNPESRFSSPPQPTHAPKNLMDDDIPEYHNPETQFSSPSSVHAPVASTRSSSFMRAVSGGEPANGAASQVSNGTGWATFDDPLPTPPPMSTHPEFTSKPPPPPVASKPPPKPVPYAKKKAEKEKMSLS